MTQTTTGGVAFCQKNCGKKWLNSVSFKTGMELSIPVVEVPPDVRAHIFPVLAQSTLDNVYRRCLYDTLG